MAMRKSDKSDTEDLDVIFDEAFWREVAAMVPGVNFLSAEEAWKDLEIMANNSFGITAEEFIDRWEKRDFSDDEMETATMLSWDVISALENQQAPATIFVQSWWAAYYPAYVADFANRGFVIGTHGDSDLELGDRTTEDVMNEILDATATIDTALGSPGASDPLFTPASTGADVRVLGMISFAGYLPVTWGIDSQDANDNATANRVAERVIDQAYDGAIVQMHLDAPNSTAVTATALPQIISTLKADGYTFVTIPEMALPCS